MRHRGRSAKPSRFESGNALMIVGDQVVDDKHHAAQMDHARVERRVRRPDCSSNPRRSQGRLFRCTIASAPPSSRWSCARWVRRSPSCSDLLPVKFGNLSATCSRFEVIGNASVFFTERAKDVVDAVTQPVLIISVAPAAARKRTAGNRANFAPPPSVHGPRRLQGRAYRQRRHADARQCSRRTRSRPRRRTPRPTRR